MRVGEKRLSREKGEGRKGGRAEKGVWDEDREKERGGRDVEGESSQGEKGVRREKGVSREE